MSADDCGIDPFDSIALFNTFLGLMNIEKNTAQHKEQDKMQAKLDSIIDKLDRLERMISDGKN